MAKVKKSGCVWLSATLEDPKRKRRFIIAQQVDVHTEPESSTTNWEHHQTYRVTLSVNVEKTGFFRSGDPELIVDSCTHVPIDPNMTMLEFAHSKLQAIKRLYTMTEIDVDGPADLM